MVVCARERERESLPCSRQMSAITERLAMYESAVRVAKEKGESSKIRRYSRALDSIKSMQKKVRTSVHVRCYVGYHGFMLVRPRVGRQ